CTVMKNRRGVPPGAGYRGERDKYRSALLTRHILAPIGMDPEQAARQQLETDDGPGTSGADQDAIGVTKWRGLDAAAGVEQQLVAVGGQRLRPDHTALLRV